MQNEFQGDMARPLKLVPASHIPIQNISVASRSGLYPRDKSSNKTSILTQIIQLLFVAVLGLIAYWIVSHKILQTVQVEGRSMVPTLKPSESYFLNKWIYALRSPGGQTRHRDGW
jgi:hypothetical protein